MRAIAFALALAAATLFGLPAESEAHGFRGRFFHPFIGAGHFHGHDSFAARRANRPPLGSLRIDSFPEQFSESAVLVNGANVGVVDDFDGFFQRLSLTPGRYEIEIRGDGHPSIQRQVFITHRRTYTLRYGEELPTAAGMREALSQPNRGGDLRGDSESDTDISGRL